jgi:hypothetical protein
LSEISISAPFFLIADTTLLLLHILLTGLAQKGTGIETDNPLPGNEGSLPQDKKTKESETCCRQSAQMIL